MVRVTPSVLALAAPTIFFFINACEKGGDFCCASTKGADIVRNNFAVILGDFLAVDVSVHGLTFGFTFRISLVIYKGDEVVIVKNVFKNSEFVVVQLEYGIFPAEAGDHSIHLGLTRVGADVFIVSYVSIFINKTFYLIVEGVVALFLHRLKLM